MADPTLDRSKSTKSTASAASNATMLKRWKSLVNPFVARDSCDGCGRGSCDNGFEGQWDNAGVPSVRPRQFSKTGHEGWPRALSNARQPVRKVNHTRFASSQAMSGADGFRITYGASTGSEDNDDTTASSARPSHSRGSQPRGSETVPDEGEIDLDVVDDNDDDDDAMGLATQRRSKRYSSQKSPLSPTFSTFGLKDRDRKSDGRMAKSILKRESIRLSALPPMPKGGGGARRSFPAGHGLATLVSEPQQKPAALNRSYVFPGTDAGVRGSNTPRFVSFNGLLDPARPENRPVLAKMISTVLLLAVTFTITFVSATLTPASLRISRGFETSSEVVILASALTVLGFAFGAPLFGACGEEYGRKRPLLTGLAMFAILNTPLAITENLATLIAFRFFVGVFGAAPLVIVPAILTDLWSPVGRGIALSFFAAVTVIGPVVGAIAGSYLAVVEFPGWRWTSWIAVVLSVFFGLPLTLVFRESSAAVLLQRKAQSLRLVTKDWSFHAEAEENGEGVTSHAIKTALLLAEPSLLLPTIHMSFACGLLSMQSLLHSYFVAFADLITDLMFVSYGYAFRTERHWLRGAQDLPLLPLIFGCFVGIFINFIVSKKKYTAVFRRDGFAPPEDRLVRKLAPGHDMQRVRANNKLLRVQHGSLDPGSYPLAC